MIDNDRKPDVSSRPDGPDQSGESGGGAYPNPHSGKDDPDFKGGQSDHSYYGGGQLGGQEFEKNENAPSQEED